MKHPPRHGTDASPIVIAGASQLSRPNVNSVGPSSNGKLQRAVMHSSVVYEEDSDNGESLILPDEEYVPEPNLEKAEPSQKVSVANTGRGASSTSTTLNTTECSNDSVKHDFGTACLKKAIHSKQPNAMAVNTNTASVAASKPVDSRYFSVKPMLHNNFPVNKPQFGTKTFKSPAFAGKN